MAAFSMFHTLVAVLPNRIPNGSYGHNSPQIPLGRLWLRSYPNYELFEIRCAWPSTFCVDFARLLDVLSVARRASIAPYVGVAELRDHRVPGSWRLVQSCSSSLATAEAYCTQFSASRILIESKTIRTATTVRNFAIN